MSFSRRHLQIGNASVAGGFGLLALIILLEVNKSNVGSSTGGVTGTRIFAVALLLFCLLWFYRAIVSSSVDALTAGVVVKTLLHNKFYPWGTVQAFGVTETPVNANMLSNRCVLTVQDCTGRWTKLPSFNASLAGAKEIVRVAEELNRLLAQASARAKSQ